MSTQALKCPGLGNGGKVNVQLRIQTAKIEYGTKFDVFLSNKKGHLYLFSDACFGGLLLCLCTGAIFVLCTCAMKLYHVLATNIGYIHWQ